MRLLKHATRPLLCVFVLGGIATLTGQTRDPRTGTWILNLSKSTYKPGPAPKSQTVTIEPSGQGERVKSEALNTNGTRVVTEYTAAYDGTDYPLKGSPVANTVMIKRSRCQHHGALRQEGWPRDAGIPTRRLCRRQNDDGERPGRERTGAAGQQRRGLREEDGEADALTCRTTRSNCSRLSTGSLRGSSISATKAAHGDRRRGSGRRGKSWDTWSTPRPTITNASYAHSGRTTSSSRATRRTAGSPRSATRRRPGPRS